MYQQSIDSLRERYQLALDSAADYLVVGRVLFTRISGVVDGALVAACFEAQAPLTHLLVSDGLPWAEALVFDRADTLTPSAVDMFSRMRDRSDIPKATVMAIVIGADCHPELQPRIHERLSADGTPHEFFDDLLKGILWIEKALNERGMKYRT